MVIDEPLWQQDVFAKNFKGMESLSVDMLKMFLQHLPVKAVDLQQAFDEADLKKLCLVSHSLKGSAAQVGCTALSVAAKNLEMATKNQPDDKWPSITLQLLYVLQQTLEELQKK